MARTTAMRRQSVRRMTFPRHSAPNSAPSPISIPIIDAIATPLGQLWKKFAGSGPESANSKGNDSDSDTSTHESLFCSALAVPAASSSVAPTESLESFSKAPGAYPASFNPLASPCKPKAPRAATPPLASPRKPTAPRAATPPLASPRKPTAPRAATPPQATPVKQSKDRDFSPNLNRFGLFETESIFHSLPNASKLDESTIKHLDRPPTPPAVKAQDAIHRREMKNLLFEEVLLKQRRKLRDAEKHHSLRRVKLGKVHRDRVSWRDFDGYNEEAAFKEKLDFGLDCLKKKRARAHNRKVSLTVESIRLTEREIQEALREADRHKINVLHIVRDARLARKVRQKFKTQEEGAAEKKEVKVRPTSPPPAPPPSPEKRSVPSVAVADIPSTPKKCGDLKNFPCFVKPGMFGKQPSLSDHFDRQATPSRTKPTGFRRVSSPQPSPSRPRTRPTAFRQFSGAVPTPNRPSPKTFNPDPTPADEAESKREKIRQEQRDQRYFNMEDVSSFVRNRKWEDPANINARLFEEKPRPMRTPQSSPFRGIPRNDYAPRQSPPKYTGPPPPPPVTQPAQTTPAGNFTSPIDPPTAEELQALERFETCDSLWASLMATTSTLMDIEISFSAFPWPVLKAPASIEEITSEKVEEFVFHRLRLPKTDGDHATRRKQAIKDVLLRWHPDKFLSGRALSRVVEEDRERVKEAALAVGQILVGFVGK